MTLAAKHFGSFVSEVHGYAPFPWQQRLLAQVLEHGWPGVLDLPTASGKTTVIDVAVYALAVQAAKAAGGRTTPMRVAFVVDRRIVVDAAHERAERLAESLRTSKKGVAKRVAEALLSYGAEVPLRAALLRGGIYREDRYARQPNQPLILCSTVDQVGSRLLHRGYGLGSKMWPIHAGLLGEDALIVIDEAHCSVPFCQTLGSIASFRDRAESPIRRPWSFVSMSATTRGEQEPFRLDDDDRRHPCLGKRIASSKPISLVEAPKGQAALVKTITAQVGGLAKVGMTLLCVVNRVQTARDVHSALSKLASSKRDALEADVLLLTGRSRSLERDLLLRTWISRLMAGRDRASVATSRPLIIVATQCVEVGADFDVDALVSEAAPIDSLRQRLGRLDRLAELGEAPCTIVCPAESAWNGSGDPYVDFVYGEATARTWAFLVEKSTSGPLDGGSLAFGKLSTNAEAGCVAPAGHAPTMLPAHCDMWAHTGPVPSVSPEPALFLHGCESGEPDVNVVFRADLDGLSPELWVEAIALCPPVSAETLGVRLSALRSWLAGDVKKVDDSGDIVGAQPARPVAGKAPEVRPALWWRGPSDSEVISTHRALRAGATLIVPSSYGGCDDFGWAPRCEEPVRDIADEARIAARRAPTLRLVASGVCEAWPADARRLAALGDEEVPGDLDERVNKSLQGLAALEGSVGRLATSLLEDGSFRIERHPSGAGLVVIGGAGWASGARDFTDEDDGSSLAPCPRGLEEHLKAVGRTAESFGRGAGLSQELQEDLGLAGRLHDAGKADPRFQTWLYGGNRLAAKLGGLLAKSNGLLPGKASRERSRKAADYPRGARHELLSVRLAESASAVLKGAHDLDLVLHLIESHHGHCRPFAPHVEHSTPVNVEVFLHGEQMSSSSATGLQRLDAGPAQRFHRLLRRYGWWGLSYLESCLRLADHRVSEDAQQGGPR